MAWFRYECSDHGQFRLTLPSRKKDLKCPDCDNICKPIYKAPSVRIIERLDNGAMGRRVERLHNIEDIMYERDKKYKNWK